MRTRALVPAALLAVALAGAALAQGWKPYNSAPGKFSIDFPGTPETRSQDITTRVGKVKMHLFQVAKGQSAFLVSYSDYPASAIKGSDPKKMLDGARDGAVSNVQGKLLSEKGMSIGGNPGRELKVEAKGLSMTQRMFLVKNRLYQVLALVPIDRPNNPDVPRFLNSFKIRK